MTDEYLEKVVQEFTNLKSAYNVLKHEHSELERKHNSLHYSYLGLRRTLADIYKNARQHEEHLDIARRHSEHIIFEIKRSMTDEEVQANEPEDKSKRRVTRLAQVCADQRKEFMWSQANLAYRADISLGTIASIESGHSKEPRIHTLQKLARAFGMDYATLVKLITEDSKWPTKKAPADAGNIVNADHVPIATASEAKQSG